LGKERRNGKESHKNRGVGLKKVFKVEKSVWKGRIRENTNKKNLGLCNRSQEDVQTIKRENLPSIQKQKRRSLELCKESIKKGVH